MLIAYVETEGVSLRERRRALAEYGFHCRCDRCTDDERKIEARRLAAAAGGAGAGAGGRRAKMR